jgi:hypothetical protein
MNIAININTLDAQNKPKDNPQNMSNTVIKNSTKAKIPKGTLSFKIDNKTYVAYENMVQCMFVGMGTPSMSQGIISGKGDKFNVTGVMMVAPTKGSLKIDKKIPVVGLKITLNGIDYNSVADDLKIQIDKITQDGNNHYIGGTFSGTFKSTNGQSIKVTDGKYQSAYL